jgi:hypothetical protein
LAPVSKLQCIFSSLLTVLLEWLSVAIFYSRLIFEIRLEPLRTPHSRVKLHALPTQITYKGANPIKLFTNLI